jgi:hypothetical protein
MPGSSSKDRVNIHMDHPVAELFDALVGWAGPSRWSKYSQLSATYFSRKLAHIKTKKVLS